MTDSVIIAAPLLIAAIVMAFRFVGCRFDTSGVPGPGGTTGGPETPPTPHTPETTPFTMGAGTYPWPIPDWCNFIDLFLLGAGGGGASGIVAGQDGDGGLGGQWSTNTIHRGSDLPETTKTIDITLGSGGKGGQPLGAPATDGGPTTATAAAMTTQTALGGGGGANPGSPTGTGPSPASTTDTNTGETFAAGGDQATPGGHGNPFGGGGAGGTLLGAGGDGADGAAWVVARQN
jgi:hypothetical protein